MSFVTEKSSTSTPKLSTLGQRIQNLWRRISPHVASLRHRGTAQAKDERELRRIVLSNSITLTLAAITLPYTFLFWWMQAYVLAALVVPIVCLYAMMPIIVEKFSFTVGRLIIFTLFPLVVSLYSLYFGEKSNIHLLFFADICLPVLMTDVREKKVLTWGLVFPVLTYMALEAVRVPLDVHVVVNPQLQFYIGMALVPTTFLILLVAILFFAVSSQKAQVKIDAQNQEMQLILDTVDQGLLTITPAGEIVGTASALIYQWFGETKNSAAQKTSWTTVMEKVDPKYALWMQMCLDDIESDLLTVDLILAQMPTEIHNNQANQKIWRVSYTPIYQKGHDKIQRILLAVTDITEQREQERREEAQRDVLRALEHVGRDRKGFLQFLQETKNNVEILQNFVENRAENISEQNLATALRILHTIKGNAAIFGMTTLSKVCHHIEDTVKESGHLTVENLDAISLQWGQLCELLRPLVQNTQADDVILKRSQIENLAVLLQTVQAQVEGSAMVIPVVQQLNLARNHVSAWLYDAVDTHLHRLAETAKQVATRLDKPALYVHVDSQNLYSKDEEWASVWSACVHVVRNAVDHGIENAEVRQQYQKPPSGNVWLQTYAHTQKEHAQFGRRGWSLSIRDDGAGIDWEKLGEKAKKLGLSFETEDDRIHALFADGVSSKSEVSDISGRGIGMGALLDEVKKRGGIIQVFSKRHEGTTFLLSFPHADLYVPASSHHISANMPANDDTQNQTSQTNQTSQNRRAG